MTLNHRIARTVRHEQTTPSKTWTIVHNLGDYPIVDVFVIFNDVLQKIMPASISYVDANTCSVSFTTAFSGYATIS